MAESPTAAGRLPATSVGERFERWLQRSPPFTLSLTLHTIILLALAVLFTHEHKTERMRLDLVFGPEQGSEQPAGGVAVEQEPAAAEEPAEPEPAPTVAAVVPRVDDPEMDARPVVPVVEPEADAPPTRDEPAVAPAAPLMRIALTGRSAGRRDDLVVAAGGGSETETAVGLALEWLVRNQEKSGLWSLRGPYLDGSQQENRLAATAMALLALQGAGNTPDEGLHREAVRRAWKALLARQLPDGTFDVGTVSEPQMMYAHAQATIALCEAYGMTRDASLENAARRAVDYAVAGQMPDGGWKYHPPKPNHPNRGDMSVTGWYMMALKSAEMAGLAVPPESYERLGQFLDAVFVSDDAGYGYEITPHKQSFQVRPALTAEALLCRQYLGWHRDDPRLLAGVDLLFRESRKFREEIPDVYAWYYVTQVCHHLGGEPWKKWNGWMRATVPAAQVSKGREKGSWNTAHDKWGYNGGRLYMTCLCTCMLEVYYRHLPLYSAVE